MNRKRLIIAALILPLLSLPVFANEYGEIQELRYLLAEPVVFEDMDLFIGVNNPDENIRNYLLEVEFVKEGKIVASQEFTFSLQGSKKITFTPTFVAQDIGRHEIIVKLYDKFRIDLYDTKIISFDSISNIGPFDIVLETLTNRVRPNFLLPTRIILTNMGQKGVDVEVRVSINCPNGKSVQTATVFSPSKEETELLMSTQACEQDGLYEAEGSIILFNKTWITSSSSFFVNSSYVQLDIDITENITIRPGDSWVVPVTVRNNGNEIANDLKFVVQRVPAGWQTITPASIAEIRPNETVIFIINITVPRDAEAKSYEARMTAVSRETLERKIIRLEVLPLAVLPATPQTYANLARYALIGLSSIGGLTIVAITARKYKSRKEIKPDRHGDLQKLREVLLKKKKQV